MTLVGDLDDLDLAVKVGELVRLLAGINDSERRQLEALVCFNDLTAM